MINDNIRKNAKEYLPCEIRDNHREFLKKYIFCYTDLRNFHVIRYFTHTTKGTATRLFPVCDCGMPNSPEHGANECTKKLEDREIIKRSLDEVFRRNKLPIRNTLYDYLLAIYYTIDNIPKKDIRFLVGMLKTTIMRLIVEDESKCILDDGLNNKNNSSVLVITEDLELIKRLKK